MIKHGYIRQSSGIPKPEVEKTVSKKLSESELSARLDSLSQMNSDLDKLEASRKSIDLDAMAQEIASLDDSNSIDKLSTEPSHWPSSLTIDVETSEISLSSEPQLPYKPVHCVIPTMTEPDIQSPTMIHQGAIFKQTLLSKRIMIDSFLCSLTFSISLLVLKSAVKSIIITARENRESDGEISSYKRLRGGGFMQRAFDHFRIEMELKIDEFLNNPVGALFLKRLILSSVIGVSSGFFVWLVYCLSIHFGVSNQANVDKYIDKYIRSLKSFSEAWSSFIISAVLVGCVGTVFGLLILSGWSMYLEISSFDHSRRNALLERERVEKQRLLKIEKESIKLMERLSKLDKSKLEKYVDLISKKKVPEKEIEDVGKEKILAKDKESQLSASDKLRLKICSINEASRKILFYTCPNLYQSEYTGANLGSQLEKAVFNFLSGEDIETTIEYINAISDSQLREELGDIDEDQPLNSLSEQSLCLVAIRIGLIKEFMPELYTGFDRDIRKFLDDILAKGFKRCAVHAEDAKLFDYGGQKNLASDKPKFALFNFDSPRSSKGYKTLRGGSLPRHLPFPTKRDVQARHKESIVRFFGSKGYAGPNGLADFYGSGNAESKKNRPSILWQDVLKDRTLLRTVYDSLDRNRKANYGLQHTIKIQGSLHSVSTFSYMPKLLAEEFNRLQKVFGYRTPPVLTRDFNEIARREVLSNLAVTLEDYDLKPDDPAVVSMAKTFSSLMSSELGEAIRDYNENIKIIEADKERETVEIFKMLDGFAQNLQEKAKEREIFNSAIRREGSVDEDGHIPKLVAEMVRSVTVQITGASSLEDVTEEVKRLLRRIVESNEGVHNYEQIKYMVAIFMLRRHVKINSSLSQKLNGMVLSSLHRATHPVCNVIELILDIPEATFRKCPKELKSFLMRQFTNVTASDVSNTFAEVKEWVNGLPTEMEALYKKSGGTHWEEKKMSTVLAKLAGFDKRPFTKDQELYKEVAKQIVDALVIKQQVLQTNSLSWQLVRNANLIDGVTKEVSSTRFQKIAATTAFSLDAVDGMNKGYELTDESRTMSSQVEKMAKMLDRAAKQRSGIDGYPTQTVEEVASGSPTSKPAIEELSMYLLRELSDIMAIHRAFRIDEEDGRVHGFFGHYDKTDSQGRYSSPTQNSLWALTGIVYNPGYGQFEGMENAPFNIRLKKPVSGNVATFGYDVENESFGSATSPQLYVMFNYEDGNGPVLRPLIKARGNGGLISHETQITNGPTISEIKNGEQFNIPALAKSRKSAALCLTQPTNLPLSHILEHWISNISVIADGYETGGKADGSFYDRASVKDILMQYCDDFNNATSYEDYIKELIEMGEMPLTTVSERNKNRTCVRAYAKESVFQSLYNQFNVPLLDRVGLSDPDKIAGGKKVYGSSMDKGSVNPAKINKLSFDPTFALEIFRVLTHYPLVMLSTSLQGKLVGDEAFCVKILACYYRQKTEELKKFRGSEEEFAERYPYCRHKNGLAGFIHEFLNDEIIPLIQAAQSGSDIIVNENFIMRCCESNVIRTVESEDEGTEFYEHATNGVRNSVLRSICKVLPEYIGTVDDLELFFAMVQVEWGSGRRLGEGYVTLENGEMTSMNEVAQEVEAYIKYARDACITKDGKRLIRTNLISSLQNLINDIHKTHPLRSSTLFHEFTIHRLIAFSHFLHVSNKKQKNNMKKRLTKS